MFFFNAINNRWISRVAPLVFCGLAAPSIFKYSLINGILSGQIQIMDLQYLLRQKKCILQMLLYFDVDQKRIMWKVLYVHFFASLFKATFVGLFLKKWLMIIFISISMIKKSSFFIILFIGQETFLWDVLCTLCKSCKRRMMFFLFFSVGFLRSWISFSPSFLPRKNYDKCYFWFCWIKSPLSPKSRLRIRKPSWEFLGQKKSGKTGQALSLT